MKKNTELLQPETYYHIYNRGNNKETIFKEERNYRYFLELYAKYIEPIADTYAYCLMGNHFHFLIRTKSEEEVLVNVKSNLKGVNEHSVKSNLKGANSISAISPFEVGKIMSNQFSKLFNSYTQAINKAYGRTGSLFEHPFRRIAVEDDAYLSRLVAYIHQNPEKHGVVTDFKGYPYSSYHAHLSNKETKLKREEILEWFGGVKEYESFHKTFKEDKKLLGYVVE